MSNDLWFSNEPFVYSIILLVSIGIGVLVFILLFFITAGYGRHVDHNWGPKMNTHLGWFVMELPTVVVMLLCFALSDKKSSITHYAFLIIWFIHYAHRVFIYPFRIKNGKKITLTIVAMGFLFNLVNVYIQGRWLFTFSDATYADALLFRLSNADYSTIAWLYSPQFIIGTIIFSIGYFINKQSDYILRNLRKPGEMNTYKIPEGGLYRFLSCPNYLGEIIEWIGWAVLTWSITGLFFAFWTVANLFPRAISHHKWYKKTFEDYPKNRKAIIPFLI